MKGSTAMSRLTDVCDGLDRAAGWPDSPVTGACFALLPGTRRALVVDEPPEVVPWISRPAHLEALAATLRFTKLPLSWRWRPAQWPVWNHAIDRAVRVWSSAGGRDQRALDALAARHLDDVMVEEPANTDEFLAELLVERDVARHHLVSVRSRSTTRIGVVTHRGDGITQKTIFGGRPPASSTSTTPSKGSTPRRVFHKRPRAKNLGAFAIASSACDHGEISALLAPGAVRLGRSALRLE